MDTIIDVISVVAFISLIMYAAAKLDEASRELNKAEEEIYREHLRKRK